MYLYFGLNINDLEDFCQLMDKEENEAYTVNNKVFINKRDGVFIKTFIAKLIHVTEESFVIIGFDDRSQALRSLDLITLKSFKDCNKEIRVKLFDAVSNVNIRDNFKYTVRNGSTKSEDDTKSKKEEPRITNKLEKQLSWDCKPLNMSKRETEMIIKDIKVNGPATIVFWLDGDKTIVKCQKADNFDIEKGIIMALVKGIFQKYKGTNNWTEAFKIPYADEVDVEKVIGLGVIKDLFGEKDHEWHYKYVLKWVYKIKNYKFEDEVKALTALGYSSDRIKKCLKTNLGAIRDALNPPKPKQKKTKNEVKENLNTEPELGVKPTPQYEVPIDGIPLFNNELLIKLPKEATVNGDYIDHINLPDGRKLKFVVNDEQAQKVIEKSNLSGKIVNMFNSGIKIRQIAKELNITEYFVKKALDEITKPKANPKKAERILNKAVKEKKTHKTHIIHTEIEFPNYLEKEECEKILEETKVKYADRAKINCMSELQKYFDRECKHYKINQLYGNGYSMYEIGRIIGISASAVQRMHNADSEE